MEKPLQEPWVFLSMVLIFPVLEEIVFRGLIQEQLAKYASSRRFGPISIANLFTSLLFVAAHLIYQPVIWALLVFFPSLLFGYTKERYASLWPPISLHVFYNLGFFMLFAQ